MAKKVLSTTSLAATADNLEVGIDNLLATKTFTSQKLRQDLTNSLEELSLRVTQVSNQDKSDSGKPLAAQSRRQLVKAAQSLKGSPDWPEALSEARLGCMVALRVAEHVAAQQMVTTSQPVFQTLSLLERSSAPKHLFLNVKLLGMRLLKFLDVCGRRVHDVRGPTRRCLILKHVYTIHKLLPVLVQALRDALTSPKNVHMRASRELFFGTVRDSAAAIVRIMTEPSEEDVKADSEVGLFIRTVDLALDSVDAVDKDTFGQVQDHTEWLISFAMSVSKAANDEEIPGACHNVVNELASLKAALDQDDVSELALAKDVAKDFVEVMEQTVNCALLRLIIGCLSQLHSPIDRLIHAVLTSDVSPPDRRHEDLQDLMEVVDDHSDRLFHVAHFATFCTTDVKTSQDISNSLHLMQFIEKELVPAALKLYFNCSDPGARAHLKTLRALWRSEMANIEACVLGIVDTAAFCVIVDQETNNIASLIKKQLYTQDRDWVRQHVARLVRMCQMVVDLAWKELLSSSRDQLPDDHPIIKVERSSWEVQSALKLVLANIEDLTVHKIMLRRVQLMATCMSGMVALLTDMGNNDTQVKVLTSVTKITISNNKAETRNKSRMAGKSFRNVTRMKNSSTAAGGPKQKLYEINIGQMVTAKEEDHQQQQKMKPFVTRKMELQNQQEDNLLVKAQSAPNTPFQSRPRAQQEKLLPGSAKKRKDIYRKAKVHSESLGIRSPLRQINNHLTHYNKTVKDN